MRCVGAATACKWWLSRRTLSASDTAASTARPRVVFKGHSARKPSAPSALRGGGFACEMSCTQRHAGARGRRLPGSRVSLKSPSAAADDCTLRRCARGPCTVRSCGSGKVRCPCFNGAQGCRELLQPQKRRRHALTRSTHCIQRFARWLLPAQSTAPSRVDVALHSEFYLATQARVQQSSNGSLAVVLG